MDAIAGYSSSDSEQELEDTKKGPSLSLQGDVSRTLVRPEPASKEPLRTGAKTSVASSSRQYNEEATVKTRGYVSKRKRGLHTENTGNAPCLETPLNRGLSAYLWRGPSEDNTRLKQVKVTNAAPGRCVKLPKEHCKPVMNVDWHGTNGSLLLSCSLDSTIKLWDVEQRRCIATYSLHTAAVRNGQWASRSTVVTGGFDRLALLSDVENGKVISSFKHEGFVSVVKVHPVNRNLIFTGDFGSNLQSWDLRSGQKVNQYMGAGGKILDIAFLRSGDELVASSDIVRRNSCSQALAVWNISSCIVISNQVYLEPYTCPCLQVHPYRQEFYAQSNGNYIVIFSATKPYKCNKYKRFEGHRVEGNSVQFDVSPDGTLLCSASANGQVLVYDAHSATTVCTVSVSDSPCLSVAWHRFNGSTIAVSDWKANISILH